MSTKYRVNIGGKKYVPTLGYPPFHNIVLESKLVHDLIKNKFKVHIVETIDNFKELPYYKEPKPKKPKNDVSAGDGVGSSEGNNENSNDSRELKDLIAEEYLMRKPIEIHIGDDGSIVQDPMGGSGRSEKLDSISGKKYSPEGHVFKNKFLGIVPSDSEWNDEYAYEVPLTLDEVTTKDILLGDMEYYITVGSNPKKVYQSSSNKRNSGFIMRDLEEYLKASHVKISEMDLRMNRDTFKGDDIDETVLKLAFPDIYYADETESTLDINSYVSMSYEVPTESKRSLSSSLIDRGVLFSETEIPDYNVITKLNYENTKRLVPSKDKLLINLNSIVYKIALLGRSKLYHLISSFGNDESYKDGRTAINIDPMRDGQEMVNIETSININIKTSDDRLYTIVQPIKLIVKTEYLTRTALSRNIFNDSYSDDREEDSISEILSSVIQNSKFTETNIGDMRYMSPDITEKYKAEYSKYVSHVKTIKFSHSQIEKFTTEAINELKEVAISHLFFNSEDEYAYFSNSNDVMRLRIVTPRGVTLQTTDSQHIGAFVKAFNLSFTETLEGGTEPSAESGIGIAAMPVYNLKVYLTPESITYANLKDDAVGLRGYDNRIIKNENQGNNFIVGNIAGNSDVQIFKEVEYFDFGGTPITPDYKNIKPAKIYLDLTTGSKYEELFSIEIFSNGMEVKDNSDVMRDIHTNRGTLDNIDNSSADGYVVESGDFKGAYSYGVSFISANKVNVYQSIVVNCQSSLPEIDTL